MRGKLFKLRDFKWLFCISALIVAGGVMSHGLVVYQPIAEKEKPAFMMLSMLLPMIVVAGQVTFIALFFMRKRMERLLNAIMEVSEGNLDIELSTSGAGEYQIIYEKFNQMVRELKNTKCEMENFINYFSHEVKTPITSVSGFSKYLIETGNGIENEERMEYLYVIKTESERLLTLAQNTLLLTKMEACQIIPDKIEYDLAEQIRHCIIMLLPQIENKKIEIVMTAEKVNYLGNREFMEQVWVNLLGNAVKFTNEGGNIIVEVQKKMGSIFVRIEDDGIGMNEETMNHIFERYYQGKYSGKIDGNGIGLSIANRIVRLCDGEITVESQPDVGSTFTVQLPE